MAPEPLRFITAGRYRIAGPFAVSPHRYAPLLTGNFVCDVRRLPTASETGHAAQHCPAHHHQLDLSSAQSSSVLHLLCPEASQRSLTFLSLALLPHHAALQL
jgi:hypothetical protein